MPPNLPPRGLSREEAAEYAGMGVTLFDQLVSEGRMPQPAKVGTRRIWDRNAIDVAMSRLFETEQNDEAYWKDNHYKP